MLKYVHFTEHSLNTCFLDVTDDNYNIVKWKTNNRDDLLGYEKSAISYSDKIEREICTSQPMPDGLSCFCFAVKVKEHDCNTLIAIDFKLDEEYIIWRSGGTFGNNSVILCT